MHWMASTLLLFSVVHVGSFSFTSHNANAPTHAFNTKHAKSRLTSCLSARKSTDATQDDIIKLYGFLPMQGYPDMSAPCIKLATYFQMCDAEYEYIPISEHQFQNSPSRKKLPYIQTDHINGGDAMADSSAIIDQLIEMDPAKFDLDKHLTPQQVAIGTAFQTMIEESFYWMSTIYIRWATKEQFDNITKKAYFGELPWLSRILFPIIASTKILRDYRGQGIGVMDDEEILRRAKKEISAMSEYLGSNQYLMGTTISSFDAAMYAHLAAALQGNWKSPVKDEVMQYKNLVDYVDRMTNEFWAELR